MLHKFGILFLGIKSKSCLHQSKQKYWCLVNAGLECGGCGGRGAVNSTVIELIPDFFVLCCVVFIHGVTCSTISVWPVHIVLCPLLTPKCLSSLPLAVSTFPPTFLLHSLCASGWCVQTFENNTRHNRTHENSVKSVCWFFLLFFFCSLSWSFTWHILAWSPDKRIHWCDKRSEGNVHKDTYTYCTLMCTCTGNPRKHHRCGTHAQHILVLEQAGGVKFCFCAALLSVPCSLWQRGEGGDNDSISAAARQLALN